MKNLTRAPDCFIKIWTRVYNVHTQMQKKNGEESGNQKWSLTLCQLGFNGLIHARPTVVRELCKTDSEADFIRVRQSSMYIQYLQSMSLCFHSLSYMHTHTFTYSNKDNSMCKSQDNLTQNKL